MLIAIGIAQFALLFRDVLRPDRKCRVRAAGPAVHSIVHRADAGVLFWGWLKCFVQHSLVPVVGSTFILNLRAIPEPVRADAAARPST